MITKSDVTILLNDLQERGVDINGYLRELYSTPSIPSNIIKFLNENRSFDIANFYEKLRHNYNKKRSDLYLNIVKELDDNVEEVLTTLASYNLQVLLYARNLEDKEMFYRNSRVEEVTRVLNNYYKTFDIESCIKVLSLIKADIKVFESLRKEDKE
jgi:DNA-binding Lrp family transcriptional regulator